jgi:hypothetical protein
VGGEGFGCLALMTDKGLRLAKDQVQTLNACVNHLALALRNALMYRQVKIMADRDGLTKIGNRRSFEPWPKAGATRTIPLSCSWRTWPASGGQTPMPSGRG